MDDENLHQEGYFDAFATVINDLEPNAAHFDFMLSNIRAGIAHSSFLSEVEKQKLTQMVHIMLLQAKP